MTDKQKEIVRAILITLTFIGIIGLCYAYWFYSIIQFDEGHKMNELGDSFGALNTLFSGLAFGGVIVTMLMQSRELKNQQQEMRNQQKEMRETREEFEMQRATNLVYQQLSRFEEALKSIQLKETVEHNFEKGVMPSTKVTHTGNHAISWLNSKTHKFYHNSSDKKLNVSKIKSTLDIYQDNIKELEILFHSLKLNIDALQITFDTKGQHKEHIEQLKQLFLVNINQKLFLLMENIVATFECVRDKQEEINTDFEEHQKPLKEANPLVTALFSAPPPKKYSEFLLSNCVSDIEPILEFIKT